MGHKLHMSTLSTYLKANGVTQEAFAEQIGVSQAHIAKICGVKKPSLAVALRIERATDGAVPASSWIQEAAE